MDAIDVQNLTKSYGKTIALEDASFKVSYSDVFGLIGPNGAGKTSLITILAGLRRPTKGHVSICDFQPNKQNHQAKLITSVILDEPVFLENLKVKEFFRLICRLYDVSYESNTISIIERWEMHRYDQKQLRFLSRGLRRKVSIVAALIRPFKVMIMDEPFKELDIDARRILAEEISHMRSSGKAVLITSHEMAQIERLCTRVGILRCGKLILDANIEEIRESIESTNHKNFEDFVSATLQERK